jgi:hypothetical protein
MTNGIRQIHKTEIDFAKRIVAAKVECGAYPH